MEKCLKEYEGTVQKALKTNEAAEAFKTALHTFNLLIFAALPASLNMPCKKRRRCVKKMK